MKVKFGSRCNGMKEACIEVVNMTDECTEADLKNYENPELLGIPDPVNIPQTECKE